MSQDRHQTKKALYQLLIKQYKSQMMIVLIRIILQEMNCIKMSNLKKI